MTDPHNATILTREWLNEQVAIVRVRPDSGEVPPFTPGQFCTLGLPSDPSEPAPLNLAKAAPPERPGRPRVRLVRRAYSIASAPPPLVRDHLELLMVLVPQGRLTPRLWQVPVGGRLFLEPKIDGRFTLEGVPTGKDLVMVATGTGIAPYVSMLRAYGQEPGGLPPRWRRFVLIHGVRSASDLAYRQELEARARRDPRVVYIPTATREPEAAQGGDWTGCRGRVQCVLEPDVYQRLVGAALDPAECHVFLCGNPAMIDEAEKLLAARGFVTETLQQPGNVHFERYW